MKKTWKELSATRSIAADRQVLTTRRASCSWVASMMSVIAVSACSSGGSGPSAGTAVPDARTSDPYSAPAVRAYLGSQVPGGITKLQVPATDSAIPVPPAPAAYPGRYDTTEPKRYLGKLLFHDPIRTQRVNKNQGQPLDFPAATAFGGTIGISDSTAGAPPNSVYATATTAQVQAVRDSTVATGSCGACHIGESAGKAGQLINFNTGGEGRGYTDATGNFVPRRRPQASLIKLRSSPLFPGDVGVDALPTLTDIFIDPRNAVQRTVTTPALFYHTGIPANPPPAGFSIVSSGRLDQLDSVGRLSPSMVGFAFNNRLLFGGFGGEPHTSPGSLQPSYLLLDPPVDDPAQENLNFLLLDAHRMLNFQSKALQAIPAFVQAFKEAFPTEAATYAKSGKLDDLVNDFTESRAQATFLRTVVTRNTPYDQFLAGNDAAMTKSQLRGARLFFTKATEGGASCFQCHSGPMLNKQPNDPDLAGVGQFVSENFVNVGIGDHPVQALNAYARGHETAYHAEDVGRQEITQDPADAFRFRSLTLRQLKDGSQFFHNGSFTSVREVVSYFNNGVPQDPTAGAAATLDPRFTSPRGAVTTGLGLNPAQIDDLTDFIENGLYDPTFKDSFNISKDDLDFTNKHPTLKAAGGTTDGVLPSGSAMDDNDHLSRRDQGLEFVDVGSQVSTSVSSSGKEDAWVITNTSASVIDTHLLVILTNLAPGITVDTASKTTGVALPGGTSSGEPAGEPYYRVFLPGGVLSPGQSISLNVTRTGGGSSSSYTPKLLSGQGKP